ncbi:MAG TPA: hypothetical protein VGG35_12995 [Streptosporangiaceae bacterium]|jgi:hypothetical protein
MTAAVTAPARPGLPHAAAAPLTFARLVRIELRRNAVPWVVPVMAALLWFDSYRPSTAVPAFWMLRTFWNMGQGHTIIDTGPLVAGVAAWMGSRDARRGMADLAAAAARPRWTAQLATWAATAAWAVGAYLALTGALFAVYAAQGLRGTPPWWWLATGAVAVAAFSAAGFAVGALFPSRFAAPLAAFGAFLAMGTSSQAGFSATSGWALLLPTNANGNYQVPTGIDYHYLPDLPIARLMFLGGIAVAAVGLLGLRERAGGQRLRAAAAAVTLAGVAATATAVGLATTARQAADGIVIPALHDAASDRPLSYTPSCQRAGDVPVCLNPVFGSLLAGVTAGLRPALAAVAGLPGAPARVTEVAGTYTANEGSSGQAMTISGRPPVLRLPLDAETLPGSFGQTPAEFAGQLQVLFLEAFTGTSSGSGSPAQHAVLAALLQQAGQPFGAQPALLAMAGPGAPGPGPGGAAGPVYAAARRLAALPAATRHAWLAGHLAALRSGAITLGQLP